MSEIQRPVVERAAAELGARYVFPDLGKQAGDAVLFASGSGAYDLLDGPGRARRLTEDLQAATGDLHLRVYCHPEGIPSADAGASVPPPADPGVEKVEVLDGNLGYLKLARFPPEEEFAPEANAAMSALAKTAALIVDLRECKGGAPSSVAYMCSFFFDPDRPVHLNTLHWRDKPSEEFWTTPVPSYHRGPLYVLTSSKTFSGGEEFANNMKALGRGTLVGETTRGGAHPGTRFPLDGNFEIFIPVGRAENPITKSNWEGTGVSPDVAVAADDALGVALADLWATLSPAVTTGSASADQRRSLFRGTDWQVRKLEGTRDLARVSVLMDACVDYFEMTSGGPPGSTEAEDFLRATPPGKTSDAMLKLGVEAIEAADRALVGVAHVCKDHPEGGVWYIGLLLLHPAARSRGIGHTVVDGLSELARSEGAERMMLSVLDANEAAARFWCSVGFRSTRGLPPVRFGTKEHSRTEFALSLR